jgi:hypothetical protein
MTGIRWVRVYLEKFGCELIAALDVARDDLVFEAAFLEQDRDLLAVRGRPVMQIDHRIVPCCVWGDSPRGTLSQRVDAA